MAEWVMNQHPNDAEKVLCPHCKGYNSIMNELADGLVEMRDEEAVECAKCDKFFEVVVEFEPLIYTSKGAGMNGQMG